MFGSNSTFLTQTKLGFNTSRVTYGFNGDGVADILWRNSSNGVALIWDMNTAGGHTAASLGTVATNWQVAT